MFIKYTFHKDERASNPYFMQGSNKVPSGRQGQVDCPGKFTFHSHSPNGQGIGKSSAKLIIKSAR